MDPQPGAALLLWPMSAQDYVSPLNSSVRVARLKTPYVADITAKLQYIRVNYNIAITIFIEKHHTGYISALLWLYSDSTNITLAS